MPLRSIVFWYNAPTIHQFGLIRALAEDPASRVTMAAFHNLLPDRREMGWSEPDFGRATRTIVRTDAERDRLIAAHAEPDALHVFSGIRGFAGVYGAFRRAALTRARLGVMAIRPDARRGSGLPRYLAHALQAIRFRRRIDIVFASGRIGVDWYQRVGFHASRVFEFGNFGDMPDASPSGNEPGGPYRLLYVGALVERKGVDVLLRALATVPSSSWQLEVMGDGPSKEALIELAGRLGIQRSIQWTGFQERARVYDALARADTALLPSRHDGWGSVINEALMSGTRVVCSDACGAAVLVEASGHGQIVPAGRADALRDAIRASIERGRQSAEDRAAIRRWAARVTPQRGAEYFRSIVLHVARQAARPVPPWRAEG